LLQWRHPEGDYLVGYGCDLLAAAPDAAAPLVLRPDWVYVPAVPANQERRYDLRQNATRPQVVIELVSADGEAQRTRYEAHIQAAFYGCYDAETEYLECFWFDDGRYRQLRPNAQGRYPVPPLGALLGIWRGYYRNTRRAWLRWWDTNGDLLLTSSEQAEQERRLVEQEHLRTERLAALLRSLSGGTDQEK
jgi:hypothetical protein